VGAASDGCRGCGEVLGLIEASAKAHDQDRALFRKAEALLPSAKAEGSHQTTQVLATLTWV
jgi:hypothetical protein